MARSMDENDLDGARSIDPWIGSGGSTVADAGGGGCPIGGIDALPREMLFLRMGESEICCHGTMLRVGVADPCGALARRSGTVPAPCG